MKNIFCHLATKWDVTSGIWAVDNDNCKALDNEDCGYGIRYHEPGNCLDEGNIQTTPDQCQDKPLLAKSCFAICNGKRVYSYALIYLQKKWFF